jgi:kinesin family protein 23
MSKNKVKSRVDPVEVYCRQRPLSSDGENESCLTILDESSLLLQVPECSAAHRTGQIKQLVYSFTQIFDDKVSQRQIHEQTGHQLVQDLIDGKNGLLFTYGVTGSGKTYTMTGNQKETGLLQRSLETLFISIESQQTNKFIFKPDKLNSFEMRSEVEASLDRQQQQRFTNIPKSASNHQIKRLAQASRAAVSESSECKPVKVIESQVYAVFVSCIEIYNNYIYDLLDEFAASSSEGTHMKMDQNLKESKNLREDTKGSMYIKDVTEIEVKSVEEALELLNRANKRRVVAHTDLNSESSRSHSIVTLRLVQMHCSSISSRDTLAKGSGGSSRSNIIVSQLSLVDLAGSERTKRTKNTGHRLKEAGSINSSLMALRNCMETLKDNINNPVANRKMVPYRDSKLTLLFKNYFEGFGRIKMILCINPSSIEFDETINVLKFSDLVRDILLPTVTAPANMPHHHHHHTAAFDFEDFVVLKKLQENNYKLAADSPLMPLSLALFTPDDDQTINKLIEYLEEYERNRILILQETERLRQLFATQLYQSEDQTERIREERDHFRSLLEQKEKEHLQSDAKIKKFEKIINSFHTPTTPISKVRHGVTSTCGTESSESESQSARYQQHHQQQQPKVSSSTGGQTTITSHSKYRTHMQTGAGETPTVTHSAHKRSDRIESSHAPRSALPNHGTLYVPSRMTTTSKPPSSSASKTPFMSPAVGKSVLQIQQKLQNLKDGVPVANRRNQRRSKSAEMWLDHRPSTMAKLDTVMQPKMKRKKSVNKLELNDTQKSSKYVLTYQQQDDQGEVVTNLVKGDILKSPGGGSNIVFTDVEVLQTKSGQDFEKPPPLQRQRHTTNDNFCESRAEIEQRCSIAIEGNRKVVNRFK